MEQKSASLRSLIRASIKVLGLIARNNRGLVIGILVVAIVAGVAPTVENAVRGALINELVKALGIGEWPVQVMFLFAAVVLMGYLNGVVDRLEMYFGNVLYYRTSETFQFEIIRAKTGISLAQLEDPQYADLIQRASENGPNRARQFSDGTVRLATHLFAVAAATIALSSYYWWLFPLLLVGTLPEFISRGRYARELWQLAKEHTEPWRHFWNIRNYFWDGLSINEVRLLGAIPFFVKKARALFARLNKEDLGLRKKYFKLGLLWSILTQSATGFALGYFVWEVLRGNLEIGTLTFLFSSVIVFRASLSNLFSRTASMYENSLFINDLFMLFDLKPSLREPSNPVQPATTTPRIVFENVSFTYPGRETPALRNINVVLEPGKKVALIGLNGAGKSTFVKLLCRLYDPTEGVITVDGVDLREIDLKKYYELFGVLFQEFNRYSMPVREAIAVGDVTTSIDDERVQRAAEYSRSDVFIKELAGGYNQLLGKEFTSGTGLSGGQWQKLAVARLFYRDPRVYVLDEPTAAIDALSEAEIFNRLDELPKDRTVLFISHRFSTVRSADEIIIMENGRITEQGTHAALMRQGGTYKRLFKLQADRYLKRRLPAASATASTKKKPARRPRKKLVK